MKLNCFRKVWLTAFLASFISFFTSLVTFGQDYTIVRSANKVGVLAPLLDPRVDIRYVGKIELPSDSKAEKSTTNSSKELIVIFYREAFHGDPVLDGVFPSHYVLIGFDENRFQKIKLDATEHEYSDSDRAQFETEYGKFSFTLSIYSNSKIQQTIESYKQIGQTLTPEEFNVSNFASSSAFDSVLETWTANSIN